MNHFSQIKMETSIISKRLILQIHTHTYLENYRTFSLMQDVRFLFLMHALFVYSLTLNIFDVLIHNKHQLSETQL